MIHLTPSSGLFIKEFMKEYKIYNLLLDQKYSINSTPTIIINEIKFEGSVSFKDIKKKIEKLI